MSKQTLLVMRHAKSSWKDAGLTDFERPLNRRGLRAAPLMAEFLQANGLVPNLVISSAAERARQTAEILIARWEGTVDCRMEQDLYLAGPRQYLHFLAQESESVNCILLLGHNPGLEYLIETLTGEDVWMPTAAVAVISVTDGWSQLDGCKLLDVLRPKELEAEGFSAASFD